MNCKNVQSLLSAYLDEELSGREMLDIREHLHECNDCTEELRCIEGLKRLLGGTPVPEPSAGFEDRLVSSVMSAARPVEPKRISIFALTGIAAASMLATLLILNSIHRESTAVAEQRDSLPYELMKRTRAFDASDNPLTGSPVFFSGR